MTVTLYDEYATLLERLRREPKTLSNFRSAAKRFVEWCEERGIDPDAPDPKFVEEYFLDSPLAVSTRGIHLTQLRAAFKYAMRRGTIAYDPTVDVILPRQPDTTPRTIPNRYLRTAQANCTTDEQLLLFRVAAYTGCRAFEIRKMRWQDVNLAMKTLEVIGKFSKRRLVPIHPALGEILAECEKEPANLLFPGHRGHEAHHATMDERIGKIIPTYTFHDFRRTVASSLDANGVGLSEIDEIMGWAPKTVFARHYRNVAPERLQQAILKLYANDPL